ncbi:hypothetical protein BC826DRAFT_1118787 [Russula brevipes]|nr:hypothetical protein BC826DRAFT_1118787 [Russula brevipes]
MQIPLDAAACQPVAEDRPAPAFIDLTETGELSPYAPHLAAHVVRLGIAQSEVEYHSFPIPDRCLPRLVGYVRQILDVLKDNTCRGRITAMHCRGGRPHGPHRRLLARRVGWG